MASAQDSSMSLVPVTPEAPAPIIAFPYQRLPNELKLMIWRYAFSFGPIFAHRIQLRRDPISTKLVVRPNAMQTDKDDKDLARNQWQALCRIDKFTFGFLLKSERPDGIVTIETSPLENGTLRRLGTEIKINGPKDLVIFDRESAEARYLNHHTIFEYQGLFRGITRISIELQTTGSLSTPGHFRCGCGWLLDHEYHPLRCNQDLIRFLEHFQDLKVLYISMPIRHRDINTYAVRQVEKMVGNRMVRGYAADSPYSVILYEYLLQVAEQHGLERFDDSGVTYCEIRLEDAARFFYLGEVMDTDVRRFHDAIAYLNRELLGRPQMNIRVGLIAELDLRGVWCYEDGKSGKMETASQALVVKPWFKDPKTVDAPSGPRLYFIKRDTFFFQ
ncbi:hypothetical protein GGR50DRAFT_697547 [Xylaria sp. CBS 124048]|nr:hypothetical protein GGR50DRAFT_697547 [Xylaria sp. CBS 124048]